jgi:poly-beta-1,6-N-acetyl-D-glucosamine biosynthesis protein PgaD
MSRAERNRRYHIKSPGSLPLPIVLRDILLTLVAWGLALYFCWDFLSQLTFGIVYELDTNPLNDFDWPTFAKRLRISFVFSGTVLIFIFAWALSNIRLLRRTEESAGKQTEPLPLHQEAEAYGSNEDEIKQWRQKKIITLSINDLGHILHEVVPEKDAHVE